MDAIQQAKIQDNFYALIESTNVSLTFLSHFRKHDVFNPNDIKAITAVNEDLDPMDQAYQFYKRVLRSNFNAFDLLIAALEKTSQLALAKLISIKTAKETPAGKDSEDSSMLPIALMPVPDLKDQTCIPPPIPAPKEHPVITNALGKIGGLHMETDPSPKSKEISEFLVKDETTKDVSLHPTGNDKKTDKLPIINQPKCFVCFKEFDSRRAFQAHLKIRVRQPSKCHKCEKTFCQQCQLNRHLRKKLCGPKTQAGNRSRPPLKSTASAASSNIGRQSSGHMFGTQGRVHECLFCSKRFKRKPHLDSHLQTHTLERPWSCDVCSKVFSSKPHLIRHLATHTLEKPFQCKVCRKRFLRKEQIQRHSFVHSGFRPHKCSICEKKFSLKYRLKEHLQTHSAKKFKCKYCMYCCSRSNYLLKHLRKCKTAITAL